MTVSRPPTAFVPHGGGPWPVLPLPPIDAAETESLAGYMRSIAEAPAQPPAFLVVVSAHWEAPRFTVHLGTAPSMYFGPRPIPSTGPPRGRPSAASRPSSCCVARGCPSTWRRSAASITAPSSR